VKSKEILYTQWFKSNIGFFSPLVEPLKINFLQKKNTRFFSEDTMLSRSQTHIPTRILPLATSKLANPHKKALFRFKEAGRVNCVSLAAAVAVRLTPLGPF
jgi:hypothetical protein